MGNFLNEVGSLEFLLGHILHGWMFVSLGFLLSLITLDPYLTYPLIVLTGYSILFLKTKDIYIDGQKDNIYYFGINKFLGIHNFYLVSILVIISLLILFTI